jgi:hypothetical protein
VKVSIPQADREGADLVVGDHAAGVADDVRLALAEAEDVVDVEAGVHAGHHGELLGRWKRERSFEGLGVAGVVREQVVGDGHYVVLLSTRWVLAYVARLAVPSPSGI